MQLLGRCPEKVSRDDGCIIRYGPSVKRELQRFIESSNVDVIKLNPDDVVAAIKKRYPDNTSVYLSEDSSVFTRKLILDPPFGSTECHEKGLGILWYPFSMVSFEGNKNSQTVMANDNATRPIAMPIS